MNKQQQNPILKYCFLLMQKQVKAKALLPRVEINFGNWTSVQSAKRSFAKSKNDKIIFKVKSFFVN